MKDIIEQIRVANPKRKFSQMERRMLKLGEEKGEADQAYLSVTSKNNSKNKSWDDVREELTDCAIVALDLLWLTFPDEDGCTVEQKRQAIDYWFEKKLAKWQKKMTTSAETSENSEPEV